MRRFLAVLTFSILLVGMNVALAQQTRSITFSVQFPFKVGQTTFSPGEYRVAYEGHGTHHLLLIDVQKNRTEMVRFVTRLSARSKGGVVFDSSQNTRYLSEVYMVGADGFQLIGAPAEHGHEIADATDSN